MQKTNQTNRLIRLAELKTIVGLSRSAIYSRQDPDSPQYDPSFPKPVKIGSRAIAWSSESIDSWIASKLNGVVW